MTAQDFGHEHGLGAIPSPDDPRDFDLAPLLAADLRDPDIGQAPVFGAPPLPHRLVSRLLGPVLEQGNTGRCVAFSTTGLRQQQERAGGDWPHGWPPLDAQWLYEHAEAIDGIPTPPGPQRGTTLRAALKVLATQGQPLVGHPGASTTARFKIGSYWRIPFTADAIKRAISLYGPVVIAFRFNTAWFRPARGVLPAPTGSTAGGHAVFAWGWDDSVSGGALLIRNSWGTHWGTNGNAYFPWRYLLPAIHDAWAIRDTKDDALNKAAETE